jgi:hypothetical protein
LQFRTALPSDASVTSIPSHSLNADFFETACSFVNAVSVSLIAHRENKPNERFVGATLSCLIMHIDA